ncbi:UDP-3-O-(3-hydroxymyristoyl)glucosamine N-acyltransferase [Halocynthiibacter sp. C4]|uniref:UDP-3-O-(3-hydroxymyristoyl)glucosamine N-acyltransferase n=1 Tax=Halocynthiibacter sp. C4 TaxID=2992758 RepID=UPI00237B9E8B|nr:UDP-3-O-(3-hydroxymyristoyl)glucosamine N-acyltransferase [Halocynthiibacter sp. C4]MDE0589534.1 UDP-3-O-(3-hydroxymyristoyl)glucosamine N-acyltransferase [Halocynthiibacter sp. C4]
MAHKISEIAQALEAQAFGDLSIEIDGVAEPSAAGPDDLALAMSEKYAEGLGAGDARAAIVWDGADWQALGLEAAIVVPRPRYAMSGVTKLLDPGPVIQNIHPTAVIDPSAEVGIGAAIGPFVVIGQGVCIGQNARIAAHCSIAEGARIGDNALLHSGVRIGARVKIGNDFIAQPGAVVGSDGFSFVTPEKSGVEKARESLGDQGDVQAQSWTRIHSLGAVEIGDNVELGANVAIDRGTIRDTKIGNGTKLDNLVHIGHNVEIGEDCLLCGQVGIAGSTRIGNRVVMAGQCGCSDNIFVGDDVVAGGATKMFSNVPAGRVVLGSPAVKMETQMEIQKSLRRLPRMMQQFRDLQKAVSKNGQKE